MNRVIDCWKNHQQEYQQKLGLILSYSMTKFVDKIHSTTYRTVKAPKVKTNNNKTQ